MSETKTRREIESDLIAQAWKDEAFKQQLMSNPKSAIAEAGISLPEDIEVEVIEESARTFYLVIPQPPTQQEEFSDAELETVAGGVKLFKKGPISVHFDMPKPY